MSSRGFEIREFHTDGERASINRLNSRLRQLDDNLRMYSVIMNRIHTSIKNAFVNNNDVTITNISGVKSHSGFRIYFKNTNYLKIGGISLSIPVECDTPVLVIHNQYC